MKRVLFLIPLLFLMACGGGSQSTSSSKHKSVQIVPANATVAPRVHIKFAAYVTGTTTTTAVMWAATSGVIDQLGNFTAPSTTTQINVTVTATSIADQNIKAAAAVVVNPAVSPTPPTASFSASKLCIVPGEASTLSWQVTNASTISIDNGIGVVSAQGMVDVSPAATTMYTLTATGTGGTITSTATVTVSAPLKIHAYDPSTGKEIGTAGGPYTFMAGQQVQFGTTGGCL